VFLPCSSRSPDLVPEVYPEADGGEARQQVAGVAERRLDHLFDSSLKMAPLYGGPAAPASWESAIPGM